MGKMVSQSARDFSKDKKNESLAEQQAKKSLGFIFIGIPGFSSWLTMGDSAELFQDLSTQTAVLCKIILDAGGDVDKIMGDKLLGVFEPGESLSEAMLVLLNTVERILKAEERGELPFPIAIGVNFGEVISGYLGVGAKRDFTVIGDAVNVSARIEKEAEKFRFQRCLFSETVVNNLQDSTRFRLHGEVVLKGKSSGLKLFHKI
jgi:class 3 adenylate cyclase